MTVHAGGYRAYDGPLVARWAAHAIAGEAIRTAWGRKSFRRLAVLFLVWFAFASFLLYLVAGMRRADVTDMFDLVAGAERGDVLLLVLDHLLRVFYGGVAFLTALLAVFVGAPLVADDLAANALPLYLVRPLRPLDYALGKALVLPVLVAVAVLVPGVLFYVLAGVWHPPGEEWPFLAGNTQVLERIVEHWLLASAAYGGLTLLVSSATSRRGLAAVLAGVAIFGGVLLRGVAVELGLRGPLGDVLRLADLPGGTTAVFARHADPLVRSPPVDLPGAWEVRGLALGLLALGLLAVLRRLRSVEVTS